MKKIGIFSLLLFSTAFGVFAQTEGPMPMKPEMTEIWDPEVSVVTPGATPLDAPSDAIVLFDGVDLGREWTNSNGGKPEWKVEDGCVTVEKGTGIIKTKRVFEDFQLHIEWRSPSEVIGTSQGRGNSGIFLQERYEVQVLDNFDNRTYRNGQAGSIYKQQAPLVNACKAPGEWQTYDIIYTAPRFNEDGTYFTQPTVTVLHNGVLVQNNTKMRGPTEYIGIPEYSIKKHGPGCIMLQDHGNPVSFRNIWIREL
ncbi:protein of unknown function [Mariniphaga anaerophila]|uniref:3-keto-alpha-glucoside-1,2-lyase/3-keto-2-hydroxy-glucal hydratase domain-containing protein n=1 Tax=Mariniphaga anaerophila TaxID=1484053 RepID=A0A1M4SII5_9BACT|nr:DUF1080 domain-containing protein [Mariniphaga anaerophila]SHE32084.1 protein of unknown function [Mariniphaga anaerophila]